MGTQTLRVRFTERDLDDWVAYPAA